VLAVGVSWGLPWFADVSDSREVDRLRDRRRIADRRERCRIASGKQFLSLMRK
jgi:hypothetical protein